MELEYEFGTKLLRNSTFLELDPDVSEALNILSGSAQGVWFWTERNNDAFHLWTARRVRSCIQLGLPQNFVCPEACGYMNTEQQQPWRAQW